ncbi:MAG: trimethylamine methyltransferase family protein [Sedimentisphaerales bacterium]|nr:trimethylamine methyltransferase family protein [Sedimentisphaerales bacterium]
MIKHPQHYLNLLKDSDADTIQSTALEVLDKAGLCIQSDEMLQCLADAGFRTDAARQRVWFRPDQVTKYLVAAPHSWTLHARNPQKNTIFGETTLHVVPGYGSAFVVDLTGRRREATLADLYNFTTLSTHCDNVDVVSSLPVEPTDIPLELRALETMFGLLTHVDKPLMGLVYSRQAIDDTLVMAKIVFGELNGPCLLALININSPLRLDARMAEAMLMYLRAGQAILLTPGVLMGMTAPVTPAGALVQGIAELVGVATIAQVIKPGAPLLIGTGGFGSDLRCGGGGFGRPENTLGVVLGAQLARKLKLPFRCSAMVTGSRRPDCRSGYERMMTALSAWQAGAHFVLQGMGILDNINAMSYEQFIIDEEIWGYISRLAQPVIVDEGRLARRLIQDGDGNYLMADHTVQYMRQEIYEPTLAPTSSYESWIETGGRDVAQYAANRVEKILVQSHPPHLPDDVLRELTSYVQTRRQEIAGPKVIKPSTTNALKTRMP